MNNRQKAWRNIMIAATNAALEQGLFSYPPSDSERPKEGKYGAVFDFEIAGLPSVGYVRDIGWDELTVHALINPQHRARDLILCSASSFVRKDARADASAQGWIERKTGFHLQTGHDLTCAMFSCARASIDMLAAVEIEPAGYADTGKFFT